MIKLTRREKLWIFIYIVCFAGVDFFTYIYGVEHNWSPFEKMLVDMPLFALGAVLFVKKILKLK